MQNPDESLIQIVQIVQDPDIGYASANVVHTLLGVGDEKKEVMFLPAVRGCSLRSDEEGTRETWRWPTPTPNMKILHPNSYP